MVPINPVAPCTTSSNYYLDASNKPPPLLNSAPHFFFPSLSILISSFFFNFILKIFLPLDRVVFGPPRRLCQVNATPTQFNYKLKLDKKLGWKVFFIFYHVKKNYYD